MDVKNLLIRFFTSLFLIFLFLIFISYFEEYIPFAIILIYSMIFYEILFFFKNKKRRSFVLFLYVFISLISIEIYLFCFYEKVIFLYFSFFIFDRCNNTICPESFKFIIFPSFFAENVGNDIDIVYKYPV